MKHLPFRLFFLSCILFLIHHTANTQVTRIGVKGGISIPNLKSGNNANPVSAGYGSSLAADFAVYGEFLFSPSLSLVTQIQHSGQGGKKDGIQAFPTPASYEPFFPPGQAPPYLYANYKSETKLKYLMVPVMIRTKFEMGKAAGIYTMFGPFISFLTSAKNITTGSGNVYADKEQTQALTGTPQSFDNNRDVKDELKKMNFGIEAAAGFSYHFGSSEIFLEGGVNYSLLKIQKDKNNGQNSTGAATISIGYAFTLGK